ncbi:MAG TPA: ROK family protein [Acidimicrobiales bacterium]
MESTVQEERGWPRIVPIILDPFKGRSRQFVALAVVLFLTAIGWLWVTNTRYIAMPAALALAGVLMLFSTAVVAIRDSAQATIRYVDHLIPRPAPQGRFLVGCRIGRRSISCDVIQVDTSEPAAPDVPHYANIRTLVELQTKPFDGDEEPSGPELYSAMAAMILDSIRRAMPKLPPTGHLTSIGIGVPGVVDISTSTLAKPMPPFGIADVADEVAGHLLALPESKDAIREAFGIGADRDGSDLRRDLARRIYVDNDCRCAARFLLSQHGHDPHWRNYAVVHVGTGVGSAFVLDGSIYYGSHHAAGEVGHVGLHPSSVFAPEGGARPPLRRCGCGMLGLHFETMVNYEGLASIAEMLDAKIVAELRAAFASPGAWRFSRRTLIDVVEVVVGRGRVPGEANPVLQTPEVRAFVAKVIEEYERILSFGLATLANVFDLDHVVLLGSLVEELNERYPHFTQRLDALVQAQILYGPVNLTFSNVERATSYGAALIPWDPTYHNWAAR